MNTYDHFREAQKIRKGVRPAISGGSDYEFTQRYSPSHAYSSGTTPATPSPGHEQTSAQESAYSFQNGYDSGNEMYAAPIHEEPFIRPLIQKVPLNHGNGLPSNESHFTPPAGVESNLPEDLDDFALEMGHGVFSRMVEGVLFDDASDAIKEILEHTGPQMVGLFEYFEEQGYDDVDLFFFDLLSGHSDDVSAVHMKTLITNIQLISQRGIHAEFKEGNFDNVSAFLDTQIPQNEFIAPGIQESESIPNGIYGLMDEYAIPFNEAYYIPLCDGSQPVMGYDNDMPADDYFAETDPMPEDMPDNTDVEMYPDNAFEQDQLYLDDLISGHFEQEPYPDPYEQNPLELSLGSLLGPLP